MGSSERPKQYLHLAGRTVLEWAVAPFLEHGAFERIVVALAPDDIWWRTTRLANAPQIACVAGGKERAESVRAGLQARSEEHTSELQSRENLVCRLLLEKKKKMNFCYLHITK